MFKGILSEKIENIDKVTAQQLKKEHDKVKAQAENKPQDVQDLTKETKEIQEEIDKLNSKLEQKKSALLKAFSDTLFFMRLQVTQMSWSGESCELLIQIGSRDRIGDLASNVNSFRRISKNKDRLTPQTDHVTGGVEC